MKLGRFAEARDEIERALAMTQNRQEQVLLGKKLNEIPQE
jgi:RNA polymerase sigma-70 factor, ECF subfamily